MDASRFYALSKLHLGGAPSCIVPSEWNICCALSSTALCLTSRIWSEAPRRADMRPTRPVFV